MAINQFSTLQSTINESDLTYHEPIGHGGSGDVYRATWKSEKYGELEVAAKKILLLRGQGIDEQFGNEIYFLQKLNHPNIIKYYGQSITSTHVVIITEYAAHGSLYDYLKDKSRLPPELKLKWAKQAVSGIQYLRANNILHRDIKTPNFLITAENNLKVCDFGISKDLTSTRTATSSTGTIRWLAPEVFTEEKLSPTADIFAFGIMLWELETCEEPYKGMRPEQVMFKVGNNDLRPEISENCPPILQSVMQKCWHKDRKKRPDIEEIISSLQSYEESMKWHLKHEIAGNVIACHWLDHQNLAVCTQGCVEVYEIRTESSRLAYILTSPEWKWEVTTGVAVSKSMPNSILVICSDVPYVYQYPCHPATQGIKKYKILGDHVDPWCMVANDDTAVISLFEGNTLVVCDLPDFNHQASVSTSVDPYDLSITTDYVLLRGQGEMLVKPLGDLSQDLCKIELSDGWLFNSVSFTNAREIYAACRQDDNKRGVFKYTWDGLGKPQYVNTGCVIEGLWEVRYRRLSVTLNGLLAVGEWGPSKVKVYSLEKTIV